MIVYKATNVLNNKVYIGASTKTLHERIVRHECDARRTDRRLGRFQKAIIKYGIDNFKFEVLYETDSKDDMFEKEIEFIEKYQSCSKEFGYNLDFGGEFGKKNNTTKELLSETGASNWEKLSQSKKVKALDILEKGRDKRLTSFKDIKVALKCEYCGKEFEVNPCEAKHRRFCSQNCSNLYKIGKDETNKDAIEANRQLYAKRKEDMIDKVIEWTSENQDLILNCPYNKISTTLNPLVEYVGVKDVRTVAKAFCGYVSKKEFLNELKNCVKMYAGLV